MPLPLAVIGAGRVGRSVARSARDAGLDVLLAGRNDSLEAAGDARTALLSVPDAELSGACEQISSAIPPLELVGHTSGISGLDVLEPARSRGAETFSIHPLQTFPDADSSLTGAPCAIAGSSVAAEDVARELALRLEMSPFAVPEAARAAYHAAASISSNLLVALEETAAELLERAGIENGRELLTPLVLRTAANWAERGGAALTGPIARGDEDTVERHREAIEAVAPELVAAYEALAERARAIAERTRERG
jgi:predicted short-subunit dehydrogenase-like oxidoreductase (DUF2520 family)